MSSAYPLYPGQEVGGSSRAAPPPAGPPRAPPAQAQQNSYFPTSSAPPPPQTATPGQYPPPGAQPHYQGSQPQLTAPGYPPQQLPNAPPPFPHGAPNQHGGPPAFSPPGQNPPPVQPQGQPQQYRPPPSQSHMSPPPPTQRTPGNNLGQPGAGANGSMPMMNAQQGSQGPPNASVQHPYQYGYPYTPNPMGPPGPNPQQIWQYQQAATEMAKPPSSTNSKYGSIAPIPPFKGHRQNPPQADPRLAQVQQEFTAAQQSQGYPPQHAQAPPPGHTPGYMQPAPGQMYQMPPPPPPNNAQYQQYMAFMASQGFPQGYPPQGPPGQQAPPPGQAGAQPMDAMMQGFAAMNMGGDPSNQDNGPIDAATEAAIQNFWRNNQTPKPAGSAVAPPPQQPAPQPGPPAPPPFTFMPINEETQFHAGDDEQIDRKCKLHKNHPETDQEMHDYLGTFWTYELEMQTKRKSDAMNGIKLPGMTDQNAAEFIRDIDTYILNAQRMLDIYSIANCMNLGEKAFESNNVMGYVLAVREVRNARRKYASVVKWVKSLPLPMPPQHRQACEQELQKAGKNMAEQERRLAGYFENSESGVAKIYRYRFGPSSFTPPPRTLTRVDRSRWTAALHPNAKLSSSHQGEYAKVAAAGPLLDQNNKFGFANKMLKALPRSFGAGGKNHQPPM